MVIQGNSVTHGDFQKVFKRLWTDQCTTFYGNNECLLKSYMGQYVMISVFLSMVCFAELSFTEVAA